MLALIHTVFRYQSIYVGHSTHYIVIKTYVILKLWSVTISQFVFDQPV